MVKKTSFSIGKNAVFYCEVKWPLLEVGDDRSDMTFPIAHASDSIAVKEV